MPSAHGAGIMNDLFGRTGLELCASTVSVKIVINRRWAVDSKGDVHL